MKIYNHFILCSFSEVFRALLTSYTKRQFCWPRSIVTPPDLACVTTIASMKTLKECKMVIMSFLFMNILSLAVSSASRQGKVNPQFFFLDHPKGWDGFISPALILRYDQTLLFGRARRAEGVFLFNKEGKTFYTIRSLKKSSIRFWHGNLYVKAFFFTERYKKGEGY